MRPSLWRTLDASVRIAHVWRSRVRAVWFLRHLSVIGGWSPDRIRHRGDGGAHRPPPSHNADSLRPGRSRAIARSVHARSVPSRGRRSEPAPGSGFWLAEADAERNCLVVSIRDSSRRRIRRGALGLPRRMILDTLVA